MNIPTDDELVRLAQAGDRAAFGKLLDRHLAPMRRILLSRYGIAGDDMLQAAMVRVLQKLEQFRGGNFRAWCLQLARTQGIDAARRKRPRAADLEVLPPPVARESDGPVSRVLSKELDAELESCLKGLDETERLVVRARYGGEITDVELSHRLDTSVGGIYKLRSLAIGKLRLCLGEPSPVPG